MIADQCSLVVTGFMGTGKTTVSRILAERLGRPLMDMDRVIEEREGRSISKIFAQEGEAYFREQERQLCAELAERNGLVIATGGGCLVDAENLCRIKENAMVICLDCSPAEILQRVGGDEERPLLDAEDRQSNIRALLRSRQQAYARIPYHIDTTRRTPSQVADAAYELYRSVPSCLSVHAPGGTYDVHIMEKGLHQVGHLLSGTSVVKGRVALVSDSNIWPHYGPLVAQALRDEGYDVLEVVLPAGEEHKRLATVRRLYDAFIEGGLDRSGAVLALGGGVITDMAGFAAATFMRGVPLVQMPTTLLGMVDASVGGKVAVDHPKGKNLIGAFVEPLFVLVDPMVLETLPQEVYRSGMAEIIKAGIIADKALFEAFEGETSPNVRWLIERALRIKIDIVDEDPYERGRRAVLNLGHTFAHAFEVLEEYRLAHGMAVSIGMAVAARLASACDITDRETAERILSVLQRHDLPIAYKGHAPKDIYEAMWRDKKRRGDRLPLILPRAIGKVSIFDDIEEEAVLRAIEGSRE